MLLVRMSGLLVRMSGFFMSVNPFKPSGVKWLHFIVCRAILVF